MLKERHTVRSKSFLKATIRFYNRNVTMDCIVRNISLTGAKLELDQTLMLPKEFELQIPQRGALFQCHLKWRKEDSAGVRFKDKAVRATAHDDHLARARIEVLEKENAALRSEVSRLTLLLQQSEETSAGKPNTDHDE
jgi:PilZ domain